MDPITGLVIASGEKCNGEFLVAEKVLGKTVTNLCGSTKTIVALCDDAETPYVDILSLGEPKIDLKFSAICGGQYHTVALSGSQIYSWGDEAVYGELGLGALSTCVSPMLIPTKFDVSSISSGDFHSAVVDSNGNMFSWGQNFKKQLGLYCKPARLPSGSMVESLTMTPRIVPFSLNKMSVRQVACGSTFTVAISKAGDVWAWGSGECGQLGGGRCTVQEVPKLTVKRISDNEPFVAVACGFAHTLALTSKGDIYSWGLNHNGQLGVGDNRARHVQTLIPTLTDISKIYVSVNSSACLSVTGSLFTWGSGSHYRLMHGTTENINHPKLVQRFLNDPVRFFAFSTKNSACFIPTSIRQISPTVGPQKSMKALEVFGSGFWDSQDILVKFSRTGFPDVPSRSSMGKFIGGRVVCKPPRLAEAGSYDISLSMDGKHFVGNPLCILSTFSDPTILEIYPSIVDIRKTGGTFCLSLTGSHLDSMPELQESMVVKIRNVSHTDDIPGTVSKGILEPLPEHLPDLLDQHASTHSLHSVSTEASSAHKQQHQNHYRTVTTTAIANSIVSQNCDADFLSVQISLNGADYSIPCDTHIFAHSFYADGVSPNVVCLDSPNPVATISGDGMFSPEIMEYEALLSFYNLDDSRNCLTEKILSVHWQDLSNLSIRIPPLSEVFIIDEDSVEPTENNIPAVLSCSLSFKMKRDDKMLNDVPFKFAIYRSSPVYSSPKFVRRQGGTILHLSSDGFLFPSSVVKLALKVPGLRKIVLVDSELRIIDGKYTIEYVTPDLQQMLEEAQTTAPVNESEASVVDDDIDIRPIDDPDPEQILPINKTEEILDTTEPFDLNMLSISVLLDGITFPPPEHEVTMVVFDHVTLGVPPAPKGGYTLGSDVVLEANGLPPCENAVIRIRGTDGTNVCVEAKVSEAYDSIRVRLPDSLAGIAPEVKNKKENWYFVDVSIDGCNFDESNSSNIFVK